MSRRATRVSHLTTTACTAEYNLQRVDRREMLDMDLNQFYTGHLPINTHEEGC